MADPFTHPLGTAAPIKQGVLFHVFAVLGIFTTLLIFSLVDFIFADAWSHYQAVKTEHLKVEALRNLMLSIGAVGAVIVGVWGFALAAVRTHALDRQARTAEKEADHSERKHTVETELAQRKHASDAFATAIEQLGSTNFAVRLGAVYALEALARSSNELHGPIFETLCAYVRNKAPVPEKDSDAPQRKPNVVVQAILTVIGRRDPERDPSEFRIDLRETDLRGYNFRTGQFDPSGKFDGAIFNDARLDDADMMGLTLRHALFHRANLSGTDLVATDLSYAVLYNVKFDTHTDIAGADLSYAIRIPAKSWSNLRTTAKNADEAVWPDEDSEDSFLTWDRK